MSLRDYNFTLQDDLKKIRDESFLDMKSIKSLKMRIIVHFKKNEDKWRP